MSGIILGVVILLSIIDVQGQATPDLSIYNTATESTTGPPTFSTAPTTTKTTPTTTTPTTTTPTTTTPTTTTPTTTTPTTTTSTTTTTTLPPTTASPPTHDLPATGCPDPFVSFSNQRLNAGTTQTGITTLGECQRRCLRSSTCRALNFDTSTGTTDPCIHYELVQQGQIIFNSNMMHQQKTACSEGAGAETGFISCSSGVNVQGGTLQPASRTMTACQTACNADATCEAVDFEYDFNTCYFHTAPTFGNAMGSTPLNIVHCRKMGCPSNPPSSVPTGYVFQSIRYKIMGGGGTTTTGGTTEECLTACTNDATCEAAEYNKGAGSCSLHLAGTACGTLEAQIEVTTFRKNACP